MKTLTLILKKRKNFLRISLLFFVIGTFFQCSANNEDTIKVHYLGHASFYIEFNDEINVLTDYGTSCCWGLESPIFSLGDEVPLIQTYSHQHDDHYNADRIPEGVTYTLQNLDELELTDFKITPTRTCENVVGTESSTAFTFKYKGFTICHLGDAQADIMAIDDPDQQEIILSKFPDQIDVLFMTIEGVNQYLREAEVFINLLKPRVVIPMHYWTPQYKEYWFSVIDGINGYGDRSYEIVRANSADYNFTLGDTTIAPVKVISLDPYPMGDPTINQRNIAHNCSVSASSLFDVNHAACRATDGFTETGWRSEPNDEEWFMINLGEVKSIDTVIFNFKKQALKYDILTSEDSSTWNVSFSTEDNLDKIDTISLGKTDCRYIKFDCKEPGITGSEYFIYEFEVYEHIEIDTTTKISRIDPEIEFLNCFPNPVINKLNIYYYVPGNDHVLMRLLDSSNRIIETFTDQFHMSGVYNKSIEISDINPGIYFIIMNYGTTRIVKKISVMN